jgi:hypothetical protein
VIDQPTSLPPFSGDKPTCIKCGFAGALTRHRPCQSLVVSMDDLDRVSDVEHLERECRRCEYRWPESVIDREETR